MWQPNERYPDPAVRVLDPAFNPYRLALASVERLYTGCRWAEGPVYFGDGRYLLWSDIPNNRVLRGTRRRATSPRSSADLRATPTAIPAIARAAWSAASTTRAASCAPSMTARSPCWPMPTTASRSTRPTTSW